MRDRTGSVVADFHRLLPGACVVAKMGRREVLGGRGKGVRDSRERKRRFRNRVMHARIEMAVAAFCSTVRRIVYSAAFSRNTSSDRYRSEDSSRTIRGNSAETGAMVTRAFADETLGQ